MVNALFKARGNKVNLHATKNDFKKCDMILNIKKITLFLQSVIRMKTYWCDY
jgi:hypothetical protein